MTFSKRTLALSLCAAIATSGVTAPDAFGVAEQAGAQVRVNRAAEAGESGYINGYIRPDGRAELTYTKPGAAALPHNVDFTLEATVGGSKGNPWGSSAVPSRSGTADIVTHTQTINGVIITRTFTIDGNRVEAKVHARNTSGATQDLTVSAKVQADSTDAYDVNAESPGATDGRWTRALEPGEEFEATSTVTVSITRDALDSDGDGLRDTWETKGLLLDDGTRLPINRWGADQNTPDLYLQLNWMKSEWESLGCDRASRFSATVDGFEAFAKCAKANTKDYAPTPETLKELEDLFARHGVALHIDAGAGYVSSGMAAMRERQGGKTLDYQASYFDGEDAGTKLLRERDRLLGKRASVFRVGIIGDAMDAGNQASGVSVMNDSVFYVANHEGMTTQDQLRNSILHEFGHTLNLGHNGAHVPGNTAPATNDLDWYNSVMSYAHQFNHFDYSSKDESSSNYTIPADWANLNLPGNNVGKGAISVGTKGAENGTGGDAESGNGKTNAKPHEHPAEPDVETLVRNAADEHKGKAGFRMLATKNGDNGIVTQLDGDNVARGEVRNLGSTPETYTVAVDYGTGTFRKQYRLAPAQYADAAHQVDIPIDRAAFIDSPVVPLHVTVTNSKGEQVVSDTFRLSALEYTPEEMQRVLREVLASDKDQALKDFATRKLNPADPEQKVTRAKQAQPSTPATPQGSSASTLSIVIGVLLALVGAGTAWYGWAVDQGLVAAPF